MNVYEYRDFVRHRAAIDAKLDQILKDVGVQVAIKATHQKQMQQLEQQQRQQQQGAPPPYNAVKVEYANTQADDFADSLTMADISDIPY
jgi:hypothetical protein